MSRREVQIPMKSRTNQEKDDEKEDLIATKMNQTEEIGIVKAEIRLERNQEE